MNECIHYSYTHNKAMVTHKNVETNAKKWGKNKEKMKYLIKWTKMCVNKEKAASGASSP